MKKREIDFAQALQKCLLFKDFSEDEVMGMIPMLRPEHRELKAGENLELVEKGRRRAGIVLSGYLRCGCFINLGAPEMFGLADLFSDDECGHMDITAAETVAVLLFDLYPVLANERYGSKLRDIILRTMADKIIEVVEKKG